ncbi:DegV family protein [Clostridium sp. C8-1-8]|uniref:DAK2 domain-containing protein n=1 Tax=Clostridium sp. C8-1-8 TaxID=2698831 RepID=UPI00136C6A2C|nr:DegV family protein [Clostridium sp. C8-1-8]
MDSNVIDGNKLYFAFLSGANEVSKEKDNLNKINVFPVADGDTGTNLKNTLDYMVRYSTPSASASETLRSLADGAISGARGNSGSIFAQYICGMADSVGNVDILSSKTLSQCANSAVIYAYKSVMEPVEGTILSVMKAWSTALKETESLYTSLEDILYKSLQIAKTALTNTNSQLSALRDTSLVDSGAKGFLHFIEGFSKYIVNEEIEDYEIAKEEITATDELSSTHHTLQDIKHRYCTEAILKPSDIDINSMKNDLTSFGDSLIVAGNPNKIKIHIHTNKPAELFLKLRDYGKILEQKIDDMQQQNNILANKKYNIALVTDSIADIPKNLIDKYQITVIPISILFEDSIYLDRLTIDSDSFFKIEETLKEYPTSSQPSIKNVEATLSFLSTHYDSIIAIMVSKELSGTFNVVNKAAEALSKQGKKISVINSRLNSGAQGLLVLKAAEEIALSKSHEQVVEAINSYIYKTKIYVNVNTLKYMVRGGRVKPLAGWLSKIVNIKPIVSLDNSGKGIAFGQSFSSKGSKKKLLALIKEQLAKSKIEDYVIVHGDAIDKALELKENLKTLIGKDPLFIMPVSTVVAMSAGRGSVAIAFISK